MTAPAVEKTKSRSARAVMPVERDYGTPERAEKDGGVRIEARAVTPGGVIVDYGAHVAAECVVDRYHHRCQIIDRQHEAGIRLRKLWRAAVIEPSVTASYGELRGGGDGVASTADARAKLRTVLLDAGLAVEGPKSPVIVKTLSGEKLETVSMPWTLTPDGCVAVSVCGYDEWAGGTRRLEQLRRALTALADHWKIERE
jgi:hypothetical protein